LIIRVSMFKDCNFTILDNPEYFEFENGLWTGKHQPFKTVNVIRNTNFSGLGKIDMSDIAQIEVESKKFEKRKLKEGDIVIERSGGGPKQPVGRVVYFDVKNGDYSFSNFTSRIRVIRQDIFNPKFIFYYLLKFYQAGKTENLQARTTGIRNLDFNNYRQSVEIPILSTPEQCNIVYILSKIQSAIETQEKIIQTATELKKALMQKLFTEGLKGEAQKETEIGLVPKSWEIKRVGDFCDVRSSSILFKDINKIKAQKETPIKVLALKVSDMNLAGNEDDVKSSQIEFYLENEDNNIKKLIPPLALIFPKRGAAISTNKKRITLHYSILDPNLMALLPTNKCNPNFLYLYFQRLDLRTISDKGLIPQLNKKDLMPVLVPMPSVDEQEEVVLTIKRIDAKIHINTDKLKTLQSLFKSMLHHLMTGQIRVKDLKVS